MLQYIENAHSNVEFQHFHTIFAIALKKIILKYNDKINSILTSVLFKEYNFLDYFTCIRLAFLKHSIIF